MSTGADFQNVLAHLAAIVESAHDAVIGESLDGLITSWNQGAELLFGFRSEEVIGESAAKLIPADCVHNEGDILQRIAKGNHVDHFDTVRKHKDGHLIDVSVTISPIRDAGGRVTGASMIVHDITERKQVELKLAHLSALVESSDDAIVSTNFDGVINSWNNAATRLFGYTADEVIGRKGGFLVPADQVDEEPPLLKIIQNGEHIDHYQTVRQRKDGSLINVSITISPIRNVAGDIIGASGIARDISNQKWAQEAEQRRTTAQAKLDLISDRERDVLALVVAGEPNKVIARKLDRSEKTIEKYRAGLMKTLEVRSLAELVRLALSAEL
jgi:two-component system NtrC family sensor kinase